MLTQGGGVVPALVAGALGLDAELCTVVGGELREEFSSFLSSNDVGTSAVKWDASNLGVTQYVAFIGEETGTSVAVARAAALDWRSTETQRELVRRARAAYFSTNNLDFNLELLAFVPADVPVIHNLGVRLAGRPDYLDAMLSKSTLLIGNRVEMSNLTSLTGLTPEGVLSSSGSLESIIITAGPEAARLFGRGHHASVAYQGVSDFPRGPGVNVRPVYNAHDEIALVNFAHTLLEDRVRRRPLSSVRTDRLRQEDVISPVDETLSDRRITLTFKR